MLKLHQAVLNNDLAQLQADLQLSYINVNERDRLMQTPLHVVCTQGNKEIAEALLQRSADVNAVDLNNWSPIHCAASNCHLELVELLLNHPRIKVTILSKDGTSMFHYLMRNKVSPDLEGKYTEVLEKAKAKGSDINLHGKHLETPLHQATMRCNAPAVRFLLKNNAKVNAQNKIGETALHYAVRNRDAQIIKMLLDQKADMSIRSSDGTPLEIADDSIKPFLTGQSSSIPEPVMAEPTFNQPKPVEEARSASGAPDKGFDQYLQYQQQLQQYMLLQYRTQACQNGPPSALPIFCSACSRPFTYPPGAISIKCPMCGTVNPISEPFATPNSTSNEFTEEFSTLAISESDRKRMIGI